MFSVAEVLKATGGRLVSGEPAVSFRGFSMDTRTIKRGEAFIAIKGGNFDGHDFIWKAVKNGASCIIKEKSVGARWPGRLAVVEVTDTIKALGELARFNRRKYGIPVIAVTGSNGKTTTKEMLSWVLSLKYKVLKNEGTKNNHIGLPFTLLKLDKSFDLAVLEVGTNHFGEAGYLAGVCEPNAGVITNVGPSHLEYFRSLNGVYREKRSLLDNLASPAIALINADDPYLSRELKRRRPGFVAFGYGIKNKAEFRGSGAKGSCGKVVFKVNSKYDFTLQTRGCYNVYNALAATAVGRIFGMAYADISSRLSAFKFPQGRLNFIKIKNISFLDDTYNANPSSLEQALMALSDSRASGRRVFILGDMRELGARGRELHEKAGTFAFGRCDIFIASGRLAALAARSARACGMPAENIFTCKSSLEAREVLFKRVSPVKEDIILVKGSRLMKMEEIFKF